MWECTGEADRRARARTGPVWSILLAMAKKQRWRRGRSAGEGTVPGVDVVEDDVDGSLEDVAETEDEVEDEGGGEAVEADLDHDHGTDPDTDDESAPDDDADDESDDESDDGDEEEPDEDSDEATDPADEGDDEDEEDDEDEGDFPSAVPPRQGGLTGALLGGRRPGDVVALQLLQAAHAKQAIGTALAMGLVAAVAGRPAREAGVVLLTVLVGQTILGWHNDIVDRQRDQAHGLTGKPLAMGRVSSETVWYAIIVATLLLVPLAITTGIRAGCLYLAAVAVGMLGNVVLRTGLFSWWSWAVSFALLPAYLSYGGWGGQAVGSAPETPIVVLAALLGVGIHFTRAVWGLVADHEDGWTYLPLRLGLKLGATRLLALSTLYTAIVVVALVVMGAKVGLSR